MSQYSRHEIVDKVQVSENLAGADLQEAFLHGAFLQGAIFQGANLQGANLHGANLYGANLQGANLQRADLQNANLHGANLYDANLQRTDLQNANLQGGDLQRTNLVGTNLQGADLQSANLQRADLQNANLQTAKLQNANLQNAKLAGADLKWANFQEATLHLADLQNANLQGANLYGANLYDANLQKVNLLEAHLLDTNLQGANFQGANFQGANLQGANLQGADLQSADLQSADLQWATLQWAILNGASLQGANLSSADFEYANLKGADLSGSNIFHIKTHSWNIEGVKCTHVYQCDDGTWRDPEARERCRQTLSAGQFEESFKLLPTIEMIFSGGISPADYVRFAGLVELIDQKNPEFGIKIKSLESMGLDTILRFSLREDDQLEKAFRLMLEMSRERNLEQKLLPVLNEMGLSPLLPADQRTVNHHYYFTDGSIVNLIHANGEVKNVSDIKIGQIAQGNNSSLAIGDGASINNYAEAKAGANELLKAIKAEMGEQNQDLIDSVQALTAAIEAKDKKKASDYLGKIEKTLGIGSIALGLVEKLWGFLQISGG